MKRLLLVLFLASPAFAQTPLDWTLNGRLIAPNQDAGGEVVPAGTGVRCEVRVAGVSLIVNTTAGTTATFATPKSFASPTQADADCEWVPLPGQRGAAASAQVLLRAFLRPKAPTL